MKSVRYEQLKRSNLILEMHQAREDLIKKRTADDASEVSDIDENNVTYRSSLRATSFRGRSMYQGTRMHLSPDDINRLNESIADDNER